MPRIVYVVHTVIPPPGFYALPCRCRCRHRSSLSKTSWYQACDCMPSAVPIHNMSKFCSKLNLCMVNMLHFINKKYNIDGLGQERRNSSASAVELRLSCINPSIWFKRPFHTILTECLGFLWGMSPGIPFTNMDVYAVAWAHNYYMIGFVSFQVYNKSIKKLTAVSGWNIFFCVCWNLFPDLQLKFPNWILWNLLWVDMDGGRGMKNEVDRLVTVKKVYDHRMHNLLYLGRNF